MRKTILAICIALAVFMCDSVMASAAVCSKSPDGVHHFDDHWTNGAGHNVYGGTHSYIYGYDENKILFIETTVSYGLGMSTVHTCVDIAS